jgi:cyanophycinase
VEEILMGTLLLEGGAEFGGAMREPDLRAIELAGGLDAPIRIIPTAAAPDKNHLRAGTNGIRWFMSLGATNVEPVMLINEESANDPEIADTMRAAKLIYMLGGFTHYLGQTLKGSLAWDSVLDAYKDETVIAGSSAGAMVLCEYYFDPGRGKVEKGLGLVSNACVLPHHNTFGKGWAGKLKALLPEVTLLGIDEYTGMLMEDEKWTVYGGGAVTVYQGEGVEMFVSGQRFNI